MDFFKYNKIYDFIKMSNYGITISAIFFTASIILFIRPGFSLGVDFAGGTIVQIQYTKVAPLAEIRKRLESVESFKGVQVSEFGSPEEILIKLPTANSSVEQNIGEEIAKLLSDTGELSIRRVDTVRPKASSLPLGMSLKRRGL